MLLCCSTMISRWLIYSLDVSHPKGVLLNFVFLMRTVFQWKPTGFSWTWVASWYNVQQKIQLQNCLVCNWSKVTFVFARALIRIFSLVLLHRLLSWKCFVILEEYPCCLNACWQTLKNHFRNDCMKCRNVLVWVLSLRLCSCSIRH